MGKLSDWLKHQGQLGRLTNEAGEAIIPVLREEAEIELETALNSFLAAKVSLALAPTVTPVVDELFTKALQSAGVEPVNPT